MRDFAPSLSKELPQSVELIEQRPGSFPRVRFLKPDAAQLLFSQVIHQICEYGIEGFPIARQPEAVRKAVLAYIIRPELTEDEIERVEAPGPAACPRYDQKMAQRVIRSRRRPRIPSSRAALNALGT